MKNIVAITERVSADDVVAMIIDELNGKKPKTAPAAESKSPAGEQSEDTADKKSKKLFGRK